MSAKVCLLGVLAMAVGLGVCVPTASDAAITPTAYWAFDSPTATPNNGLDPDMKVDTNDFMFFLQSGAGSSIVTPGAGQPGFGGALVRTNPHAVIYADLGNPAGSERDITATFVPTQGTLELWVSPHFNGIDEGGSGIGGSGSQQMLAGFENGSGGLFGVSNGMKLAIFNNNSPNDGGQLFGIWNTGTLQVMENTGGLGSTRGWTAGSWHHVAFTWDAADTSEDASGTVAMFMDGNRLATAPMGPLPTFSNGFSLGGVYTNTQIPWNGDIDEVIVWDMVRYSGETYDVPTTALPEPASLLLLGAGGLLALSRRR